MTRIFLTILILIIMAHQGYAGINSNESKSCLFKTQTVNGQATTAKEVRLKLEKFKSLRSGSIAMMIGGGIVFLAGEGMLFTSVALNASGQRNYQNSYQDPLWDTGLGLTLGGLGIVGGGIPIYIFAKDKVRVYKRKLAQFDQVP